MVSLHDRQHLCKTHMTFIFSLLEHKGMLIQPNRRVKRTFYICLYTFHLMS